MQRPQPVKGLDSGWHSDRHGHDGEGKSRIRTHAAHEHMMSPHHEAEQTNRQHGVHHSLVSKNRFARKRRKYLRSHAHPRQNRDVNFGMPEEPEKMLPEERRAALMPGELAVDSAERQKKAGA